MKIDDKIYDNIFMESKKVEAKVGVELKDIIHQIGLKMDECSISSYIFSQNGFENFIKRNSRYTIDILEKSFSPILYECKLKNDIKEKSYISNKGSHLPASMQSKE